ncbi:hypothetical protein EJ02DRAFT_417774 [Clathrospora elynae]|uniref:RWD domain-containing protein n=1 Tax=Clathrospora elynae TaxID=706981 RepID=A0A6A5T4T6_9PLEO|nr:hypothetical protein EJ02DRAFT_417774 [Clathrospora elynae]
MTDEEPARLETELELLEAMYPDQTHYDEKSREFKFSDESHASLLLRLPEKYPQSGLPDIISASDSTKSDLRARSRSAVKELGLAEGEEAIDAIIAAFQQLLGSNTTKLHEHVQPSTSNSNFTHSSASKTVIIWLHHLLNTNKRKLALSPPPSSSPISGLTKPGYPGILVYSGPSSAVTEHVNTLKAQNWQAFQVRYEEEELWGFTHGEGVREMESMSEVVKSVEVEDGIGKKQKEEFLKAVGIK